MPTQELTQAQLCEEILDKLDDLKAQDPLLLDVKGRHSLTDHFVIVTATSTRHGQQLARNLIDKMKEEFGIEPLGYEGLEVGDWIVVDYTDVMVHIFIEESRQLYALEKIWAVPQPAI